MEEIKAFEPHAWLRNGHAMTIASAYVWRRFRLPDPKPCLFQADAWTKLLGHCHWQAGERTQTPVIVLVHGLEGSSDSNYMLGIAEKAFERGFHVVRLNQRNCGGTERLTPTLYNSGMSDDYRAVLFELAERYGFEQIYFAGYSMGGNLITKMAGELGPNAPPQLRGVASVCAAIDLSACADALERPDNYLYQRHFVARLMARYRFKAKLFPERYTNNGFGRIRTVREFDDKITAPNFGFRDAEEYYEASSAKKVIGSVRVPMMVLTAEDDPFVPYVSFVAAKLGSNPHVRFAPTEHGGHCAFISRHAGQERFWAEARIVEFFDRLRTEPKSPAATAYQPSGFSKDT